MRTLKWSVLEADSRMVAARDWEEGSGTLTHDTQECIVYSY